MNSSAEQATTQVQSQVDSRVSDLDGEREEAFEGNNLSDGDSVASRETTSQAPPFEEDVKQGVSGYMVRANDDSKAGDEPDSHDITYRTGDRASSTDDDLQYGSELDHVTGSMPTSAIADPSVEDDSAFVDPRKYDHLLRTGLPSQQSLSEATSALAVRAGDASESNETEKGVEASNPALDTVGGQGGLSSLRDPRFLWNLAFKRASESIGVAGDQQNTQNTNVPTDQVAEVSAESDYHESSRSP